MEYEGDINNSFSKLTISRLEREIAHVERMRQHRERMRVIELGLAYAKAVEAFPLRVFGEVVFVLMN